MEEQQPSPWYKKKVYIIALAVVAILVIAGLSNSSPTQTATQLQTQTSQTRSLNSSPNSFNNLQPLPSGSLPQVLPQTNTQPNNGLSNNNYYTNVNGNTVHSPAYSNSPPAGASAICRDGTYSFSQNRSGTCSHHGGVSSWY